MGDFGHGDAPGCDEGILRRGGRWGQQDACVGSVVGLSIEEEEAESERMEGMKARMERIKD
jgi:hypothetical protein